MKELTLRTEDLVGQTNRFLDLLEVGDQAGIADVLHDQVTWSTPMSASGGEPARGREAFAARLGFIGGQMQSARFIDRRITAAADTTTTFVQARGDFVTADGRPYRNVYVFRFDWRDGKIMTWEEYANPIAIIQAFPDQFGHLLKDLLGSGSPVSM